MPGLHRISNADQLDQFPEIWEKIQTMHPINQLDKIVWKLNENNTYSAGFAYKVQYIGIICRPDLMKVWRTRAEAKVKFFLWLLLQNCLWTADWLAARGWPHSDRCPLCDQELETAAHLVPGCSYSRAIWSALD